MNPNNPMRKFDPRKVARYEKENYVTYYRKDRVTLLRASVGLVKESFGLSLLQALYSAYLVARAEMAFAPFPENDVPLAQAYMRRSYAFLNRIHREDFDVAEAARLEVNWWIVHRRLFGQAQNQELVEALAKAYAVAYGVPVERVRDAAHHRAQGMLYSDLWVNDGQRSDSPLLVQEEAELAQAYTALRASIG